MILSCHSWNGAFSPQQLASTYAAMLSYQADIIKVACHVEDISQCEVLFQFIAASKVPCIALGMGEAGQLTRILAGRYGAYLTFASLMKGKESAPGQIELEDCIQMYRFRSIGLSTKLYGVVGNPVAHSKSPAIHNACFASLSLDCVYCPLLVKEDLGSCWNMLNEMGFVGLSVTIPYKVSVVYSFGQAFPMIRIIGSSQSVCNRVGSFGRQDRRNQHDGERSTWLEGIQYGLSCCSGCYRTRTCQS